MYRNFEGNHRRDLNYPIKYCSVIVYLNSFQIADFRADSEEATGSFALDFLTNGSQKELL